MERMTSPNYTDPRTPLQYTLGLIRPEAMGFRNPIVERIREAGFQIVETKIAKLTPEQAADLYADEKDQPDFPLKILSLCAAPIQAMCLAKPMAIKEFLALLGECNDEGARVKWPGSLRSYFGSTGVRNGIVGSVDLEHARREIEFFFPHIYVDPVLKSAKEQERYLNTFVYPVLMDGIYEMVKQQPEDHVLGLAQWLFQNNPNRPKICENRMRMIDEIKWMANECRAWECECECSEEDDLSQRAVDEVQEEEEKLVNCMEIVNNNCC